MAEAKGNVRSGALQSRAAQKRVATASRVLSSDDWEDTASGSRIRRFGMRVMRLAFACGVLFAVAIAWNGVVHLVLLRSADAVVRPLYRPDLPDKMWLSLLLTAGIAILFVWGYARFARVGSVREGAGYGVFFALVAGVLVDLDQYVLFPIPAWLAGLWFFGGLIEFIVYGLIVSRMVRPLEGAA
jgi:hypothetical protein